MIKNETNLIIDNDQKLGHEKIKSITRLYMKFLVLPFFSLLPWRSGIKLFSKSSKTADSIRHLAKSSSALEFLYNFDGKIHLTNSFLDGIFTYLWQHNFANSMAVRNRIKIVKRELEKAVIDIYRVKPKKVINIFSLASGSARAVIEVMAKLKKQGIKTRAKLLDLNPVALELSKKIANDYGVDDSIDWCQDKVSNFLNYCTNWHPDVVEMVGFMDYLNQEKAIAIANKIFKELPVGGVFITCNIVDNYEHKFLSKILEWDMIYRSDKDLFDVMTKGGFEKDHCQLICEPNLIHCLAIGKK